MFVATMTSKGQMTVPKEVRDDLNIKPGDKIEFVKERGHYLFKPRNLKASDLAGILGKPPGGRGMTVKEMDEALGQALAEDDERIRAGR